MSSLFGFLRIDAAPITGPSLAPVPLHDTASGCRIVADARIDYREALCKALDVDPVAAGDADLILAAYLRWGEDCVDRLLGDFAFAIWDPRSKKLFCARDHFGMRPFYYHHAPGTRFVFASVARDIFSVQEVPYAIDEGRVADFLVPELEWIDYSCTFYLGVRRLPPGHKLSVTAGGISIAEYWEPAPGPMLSAKSDQEWMEGLVDVLGRAVEERLRGPDGQVGCMLSGGMDSGSVAALANERLRARNAGPLHTFSAARGAGDACEETRRMNATTRQLGADSTVLLPDAIADLDAELAMSIEEPFDGGFLFMKAIFLTARDAGMTALLDGGGGDVVLNEGAYITRLIRRGRLATALKEIRSEAAFWQAGSWYPGLAGYLAQATVPEWIKRATRPPRQRFAARRFVAASLISHEFAAQVHMSQRCERMYDTFAFDWTEDDALERIRKIRPNVSAGRERYGRLARFAGLEARDPFLDLNVARFCAQLPDHLLLRDGWPKWILREAMAGRLPDEVRWGRGKPHVGWVFSERFLRRELARGTLSLARIRLNLDGRIDPAALEREWCRFIDGGDAEPIVRAYVLSLWLLKTTTRPVVEERGLD